MTQKEVTQLSYEITGLAIRVHKILGPGLLESVYERCLKYELESNGYDVKQQLIVKVEYEDIEFETDMKIDLLVNDCVIVELKTHKITHQDLGQLQMYVNYYDRIEKLAHESPTVGILLCLEKNDTVVRFSLPEKSNIFASKYQLYLPSEKQLSQEIRNEIKRQEEKLDDKEK